MFSPVEGNMCGKPLVERMEEYGLGMEEIMINFIETPKRNSSTCRKSFLLRVYNSPQHIHLT